MKQQTKPLTPLVDLVGELTLANQDLRDARRAALNMMEDAIISREALRKSEEKYRVLFESIDEGFALCQLIDDANGNVIDFRFLETNEAYEKLAGHPNLEGKLCSEIFPTINAEWFQLFGRVARSGESVRIDEFAKESDRWYTIYISRVGRAENRQLCAVWNDVTQQKKAEITLRESEEKLKQFNITLEQQVVERSKELAESNIQLNQTISQLETFNYLASHDLREPLRKIITYVNLANQKELGEDQLNTYLARINESSGRMSQLINDLLDYSRLSRPDEAFHEVDLNKILRDVKSDYEIIINDKKAVIESTSMPTIRAIPFQMHQLFANLIGNGLKFNERKPHIKITCATIERHEEIEAVGLDATKKYYKIIFSDNGIGFDNQYNKKIFEVFQRLHTRSKFGGTGIGLSIVHKIAKNHHGAVRADGGNGSGATFSVYLGAS